jgi:hypothetical protein
MHNLSLFIERVHTGAYDPGLVRRELPLCYSHNSPNPATDIGLCLTGVVRRTADWSAETFDPSPLLLITSIVIENNPTQTRVWCDLVQRSLLTQKLLRIF